MRFRVVLLALLAALVAGCATPPAGPPAGPPRLTPRADIAPNFLVPTVRERMIHLARQEWLLFGQPVAVRGDDGRIALEFPDGMPATHEAQPQSLARVLLYWYTVSRLPIVGYQGELRPWSAAFIAWLAQGAGFAVEEFPRTVAHWDYIERFLDAGDAAPFVARDPAVYAPRAGDLVCLSRSAAVRSFAGLRRGPYHCDLVVAAGPWAIEVIGGNVGDTVALKRLDVDARGLLRPRDEPPWVAVLELRDSR
jgi:hypothetical protein